jgi:hypothetical protein
MDDIYVFIHPRVTEGSADPDAGAPWVNVAEDREHLPGPEYWLSSAPGGIGRELLEAAATLEPLEGQSGRRPARPRRTALPPGGLRRNSIDHVGSWR